MFNILIISAVFPPEPIVSALLSRDLAEELSQKNNIVVLCPCPTRPEGFKFENLFEPKFYKILRLNSYTFPSSSMIGRFRESYSFGNCCVQYINQHFSTIDCIYINSWPLLSQYLIVKVAKKYKIPCVMHVQDIYPESLVNKLSIGKKIIYKLLLPIDRYILKNSNSIIAISDIMKDTLVVTRNISSNKVSVVANWQNEDEFIQFKNSKINKPADLSNPFTFMYLGNNGPLAGVDFLINSFIKADISNSKLIIAGSGSKTNDCKELVKSLGSSNIEFLSVPENMVPSIQDSADVMLLPVKKNGAMSSIPSKLPAYMFSAKPIIGSLDLESDTAIAIKDSDCGLVVEPENEEKLIHAMKEMSLMSKNDLIDKGISGFEYAIEHFSKKANLQKVISVIESTL